MNSASWFFYLTDVSGGIQGLIGFSSVFIILAGILLIMASILIYEDTKRMKDSPKNEWDWEYVTIFPLKKLRWVAIPVLFIGALFAVTATLIPSKETFYLIAASQVGEQIVQLEEVQALGGEVGGLATDTIELLRQRINEELSPKED